MGQALFMTTQPKRGDIVSAFTKDSIGRGTSEKAMFVAAAEALTDELAFLTAYERKEFPSIEGYSRFIGTACKPNAHIEVFYMSTSEPAKPNVSALVD